MNLSVSQQATIAFYQWEARGRGYLLADSLVSVEPPFTPFTPRIASSSDYTDDGRVPTLFNQITNFLSNKERKDTILELPEIHPLPISFNKDRVAFSVCFSKGSDISQELSQEFLNLLSYSEEAFSFELLAQDGNITVQFTTSESDYLRLESQLKAFFPEAIIRKADSFNINFDLDRTVAIADFGLDNEFMLPIEGTNSFGIDPLTSLVATMGSLNENETAIFQVLFKGVTAPWSQEILYASSDGRGGSFFEDAPEFINRVKEKVSNPLFGVVIRIGSQGSTNERSRYIAQELARNITTVSTSEYNRLIPLSNEGYEYDDHIRNIYYRSTNRLGCILNSKELAHFVHYPNKTVVNEKLGLGSEKTKRPSEISKEGIYLGENIHQGESLPIYLDTESRLSHTHIIGATGVGKSTLIANMMLDEIDAGRGCAIFDPHGDICEDILSRIPRHRKDHVIIIDPADSEYPIGFNLLEAQTEAEKIVLASDLVSSFKRHATAWGDNMTAVLQNVVTTILESSKGGTLIELKRFLIEENFRKDYLQSVEDPSLHYYWHQEYPMVRKGIAPLLTRIDTFLRPKIVRYMLAQKSGIDIGKCLRENKVVLLKLSQGLIGESNSFLLGSLFLAKFNQAALARQNIEKAERLPYFLYLDEFQNFITPSIERILSGARKYGLGLTIAHQELGQIQDTSLLNSVLSNPKTRICFRLGDMDAKRLESGFSYFEQSDLQNLGRGEAIVRIGSSNNDFNLSTRSLPEITDDNSKDIISNTRNIYGIPQSEVEDLILSMLPKIKHEEKNDFSSNTSKKEKASNPIIRESQSSLENVTSTSSDSIVSKEEKEKLIQQEEQSIQNRDHRYLQNQIKKLGEQMGFLSTIEKVLGESDGRIDVVLEKNSLKVAFEISVTNSADYEVKNIQKCLRFGYSPVVLVSKMKRHLNKIEQLASQELSKKDQKMIFYIQPNEISEFLISIDVNNQNEKIEIVKGFRVATKYEKSISKDFNMVKNQIIKLLGKKR